MLLGQLRMKVIIYLRCRTMKRRGITEAAQQLGVSVDTLRRGETSGRLPKAWRASNTWRYYTEDDLEAIRLCLYPEQQVPVNRI